MELALADSVYDPYSDQWKDGVDRSQYENGQCPGGGSED
jgi:hypothetical protein